VGGSLNNHHPKSISFSFLQMASPSSSFSIESCNSSLNFNEELFDKMKMENNICFHSIMAIVNYFDFFIASELDEGVGSSMDFDVGVQDMLCMMQATPTLF